MPARRIPFVNGQIYHIFNRSQTRANIFVNKPDCNRAVQAIYYYSYITPPTKLSNFLTQNKKDKSLFFEKKARSEKLIDLFAYCLMPNHFHFLLEQKKENGISRFMALFQNSYAKYFNTKYKKEGSLFTGPFKAVRIETDEQLLHVSRYIHLNPYTSFVVKTIEDIMVYPWSSMAEYFDNKSNMVNTEKITAYYKNSKDYKKFVFDNAEYQQKLGIIKHIIKDDLS